MPVNEPSSSIVSPIVIVWWVLLSTASVVNIATWVMAVVRLRRRIDGLDAPTRRTRRWHAALSAAFVFGCAFRSFLPRVEGQRLCLYDAWISAAAISRAVATIAELSFVAQWTLFLRECAQATRASWVTGIARFPVPLIAAAEVFSWYATLTTNSLGSVIEESTWTLTGALFVVGFVLVQMGQRAWRRQLLATIIALNVAYVVFMATVDVPMYLTRWRADEARGKSYLSLVDGWRDATHRRVVSRAWVDWRDEIPWMSLYFTVGVWASIAFIDSPSWRDRERGSALSRA